MSLLNDLARQGYPLVNRVATFCYLLSRNKAQGFSVDGTTEKFSMKGLDRLRYSMGQSSQGDDNSVCTLGIQTCLVHAATGDVLQGQSRDLASTTTHLVKEGTFKPWSVACRGLWVCGLQTPSESLSTPRPSGHKLASITPDILPDVGSSSFSRCLHRTVVLSLHWILLALMLNCLCILPSLRCFSLFFLFSLIFSFPPLPPLPFPFLSLLSVKSGLPWVK